MYDFRAHKSVTEFVTQARYAIEILREVSVQNGRVIKFDWPDTPGTSCSVDSEAWDNYRMRHRECSEYEYQWKKLLEQTIVDFRNHQRSINSPIKTQGILTKDGISITGTQTKDYTRSNGKSRPIQVYLISFTYEEGREAFLKYLDSKGLINTAVTFLEVPTLGKTRWKPQQTN